MIAAGLDSRAAARQALVMDPRHPLVQAEWSEFRTGGRRSWIADGRAIAVSFSTL